MVRLAELIVILELHQQGMTVSAIARRTGVHRSTVAKYLARGIEPLPRRRGRPPKATIANAHSAAPNQLYSVT